jgi:hypothetical protein
MTDRGIYFHDCFGTFLSGEKPDEDALLEMCVLSNAIWGCVSLRETEPYVRRRVKLFAKLHGFKIDKGLFRPFGLCDALEVFGDCTIKLKMHGGGWWIGLPNGDGALIGDTGTFLSIDRVDGDCHVPALRMLDSLQGHAIVSGSRSFCMTCVVHAENLGIKIVPEVKPSFVKVFMVANMAQWVIFLAASTLLSDLGRAFFIGCFTPVVALPFIPWQRLARRRGAALINKFPSSQGTRKANIDDAKARGML